MKADPRVKRIDKDEDYALDTDPAASGYPDYGPGGLRRGHRLVNERLRAAAGHLPLRGRGPCTGPARLLRRRRLP